jgi:cytochrome c oxidase cbb3-type subunit I
LPLWIGGFLQGLMWANWANGSTYAEFHSNLVQMPFLDTVAATQPWWIMRGIGGVIILFGNLLFVMNMFNTILLKPRTTVVESKVMA